MTVERRAGFVSNMVSVRTLEASSLGIALCAPVLAIFYLSLSTNDGLWPHLIETVIPVTLERRSSLCWGWAFSLALGRWHSLDHFAL